MSIARFAVTRRVSVAMLSAAIVVLGVFAGPRLAVALLPAFAPPVVSVTIGYNNVSLETIETASDRADWISLGIRPGNCARTK